ncbi:MAG: DHH family phosphoesterase [Chloroflexota bacterium]
MAKRWQKLTEAMAGYESILILLHDDPDPDAVASGEALRSLLEEKLGVHGEIAHRGVIGRAENKALIEYLDLSLLTLPDEEFAVETGPQPVALVDTQPGSGNSPLPADYPTTVVIDHHGELESENVVFRDVRPWIGASSTILTQYLRAAEVRPSTRLATALFYGIKTDTRALSRDTSAADVGAYFYLLNFVDVDAVVEIENAQVPTTYFKNLTRAMQAASIYDGVVISYVGRSDYPDLTAELADLFLRLEGVNWVVCMGAYENALYLSVRARDEGANAEKLAQAIIGEQGTAGGRNTLAGGQIPLNGQDADQLADEIRRRALAYLDVAPDISGESIV